ncbi:PREDICTED: histone-lysine N-methyltransferase 2D-like [Ficedula albicollis]|uniref:histone-lysine N-methyltransferase 2D-like n=1 Tax=Ficedula albicollis TaxID=59894 RepID=UPI00035A2C32|nr:PREDICTED: histone-lysine N-methyltransferase 2D-like [Ficedula albicollis]
MQGVHTCAGGVAEGRRVQAHLGSVAHLGSQDHLGQTKAHLGSVGNQNFVGNKEQPEPGAGGGSVGLPQQHLGTHLAPAATQQQLEMKERQESVASRGSVGDQEPNTHIPLVFKVTQGSVGNQKAKGNQSRSVEAKGNEDPVLCLDLRVHRAMDHQSGPMDHQNSPVDHQEGLMDHQDGPMDHQSSPKDHQDGPVDHQDSLTDQQSGPKDHQDGPKDHQSAPMDHQDGPNDHQDSPMDHQSAPMDHQSAPMGCPKDHHEPKAKLSPPDPRVPQDGAAKGATERHRPPAPGWASAAPRSGDNVTRVSPKVTMPSQCPQGDNAIPVSPREPPGVSPKPGGSRCPLAHVPGDNRRRHHGCPHHNVPMTAPYRDVPVTPPYCDIPVTPPYCDIPVTNIPVTPPYRDIPVTPPYCDIPVTPP